jgi:ketosteroid isomerase-like protein
VSRDLIEQVRRVCGEWAAGNWRGGEELLSPDVVLTSRIPEGDIVSEGLEEIGRFMREFLGQWERYWIEPQEFIDGGEQIAVVGRQYGTGATSGLTIDAPWYAVFTFRDGRVNAIRVTPDRRVLEETLPQISGDRVGVLRVVFSEWANGDFHIGGVLLAPDVVSMWEEPPGDDVVCHGRQQMAERFRDFLANWSEFRVAAEEFIQLDDDHVLVVARQSAKGASSGLPTEARVHIVWKFAAEQVVATYWFFERAKALRLAGLSPQ